MERSVDGVSADEDSARGELREAAASLLRANDRGGCTVPSRLTYPHQWNWDSALSTFGVGRDRPRDARGQSSGRSPPPVTSEG